jgi:acyl-CoA reductase-like NAD-dependent aldehyde dehydrogenase
VTTGKIAHWVGGRERAGRSGRTGEVHDPALGTAVRRVPLASAEEVDEVVGVARAAAAAWGETSLNRRSQVLFAFREILNSRKEELAAIITEEHGKVEGDGLGEVVRGLEVVEFACGIPHLLKGGYSESEELHAHGSVLDRRPTALGCAGAGGPLALGRRARRDDDAGHPGRRRDGGSSRRRGGARVRGDAGARPRRRARLRQPPAGRAR